MFSIEGNIGAGKSTLFNLVKQHISKKNISFMDEPVNDWLNIKNEN